jgi:sugar/nucleoside kinase (ribokinase family)
MFIVLGATAVDLLASGAERLPRAEDGGTSAETVACDAPLVPSLGGGGAGTAYALARLGAGTRLWSATGRDVLGALAFRWLNGGRVGLAALARRDAEATAATTVLVDGAGRRASFLHAGALPDPGGEELPPALEEGARLLLVSLCPRMEGWSPEALSRVLAGARARGLTTALAAGRTAVERLGGCLRLVDLLVLDGEGPSLPGGCGPDPLVERALDAGASCVVARRGLSGVLARWAGDPVPVELPGLPVEDPSGTGVGEGFAAGFVFAAAQGWTLAEAGRFASAVAALVAGQSRGVLGAPTLEQVRALLAAQPLAHPVEYRSE